MADNDLEILLQKALQECARLREENRKLREQLGLVQAEEPSAPYVPSPKPAITNKAKQEEKIALFRSLFRGREDVYAVRWEGKNGKSGYSPACAHEWDRFFCRKPQIKCSACDNRELLPLTDEVIFQHLSGKVIVGVYPILKDETCRFLAVDFDGKSFQDDAKAFMDTCWEKGVPAVMERSRSGDGIHVWIFFEDIIPAIQARKLGSALLTWTMERRPEIGLASYDRLFPNQDTLPKGGYGNLIALPLQRGPRELGNSVFIDRDLTPFPDQWAFFSSVRRMRAAEVASVVNEAGASGDIIAVRLSIGDDEEGDDPWTLPPSRRKREKPLEGPLPDKTRLVISDLIYLEKEGMPAGMRNRLLRLAAFQNPEFYRAQAMRLSTFGKPRIIACAEDYPRHIGLPRGCFDDVMHFMKENGIAAEVVDERNTGVPILASFHGELNQLQQQAADAMLSHDIGVLAAATAFGKTVVAAWLIAKRGVNTLVLVHRRQLMDQWVERLKAFLEFLPEADQNKRCRTVGQIGGGKESRTGIIDVAVIQSLSRKGEVKDLVGEYGQVIVDECHHVSAFSFEQVLKRVKARYVLGLTATPIRKDGQHPIIMMQCGPIRFRVSAKKQAAERPFGHIVIPRTTSFRIPSGIEEPGIQDVYAALVADEQRNSMIFDDLLNSLEAGRSPLLLTERTEHLEHFAGRLKGFAKNVITLRGGMGKKQRRELAERIAAVPEGEERVLIGTGRYIGEGFDDARLDTLFLALPISWKGTLQQYSGRLHRLHGNKKVVKIYDYVDEHVPTLMRMYGRRLKGYKAIGYSVQEGNESR